MRNGYSNGCQNNYDGEDREGKERDTESRWAWISKDVADEMGIELTKKEARTADNRLAEGVLSAKPVNFKLTDYEVNLWLTPCVAEWLAEDIIIGNGQSGDKINER